MMKTSQRSFAALLSVLVLSSPGFAAEAASVRDGAQQVETGAKEVGRGLEDTTTGIGTTVVGAAKTGRDDIRDAEEAAQPEASRAWSDVKGAAVSFGDSVRSFFTNLFKN